MTSGGSGAETPKGHMPDSTARLAVREEMPALGLLNALLAHRMLIVGVGVIVSVATAVITLLQPRYYTSSASFMPQSARPASNLSGIAAQFGLTVSGGEMNQVPAFYVELLGSRPILEAVADSTFTVFSGNDSVRGTLADILRIRASDSARRRDETIRRLRELIGARLALKTGTIHMSVTSRYPALSRQIAMMLLADVNRFNLNTRQSQAAAERRFVAGRLGEVQADLRQAEDRLQAFLQRNRDYRNSPQLLFEQERMSREITMRQQVYTLLAQSYEQATIDEVRDTPVITIVEPPELAARPDSRRGLRKVIMALLFGLALGGALAYAREATRRADVKDSAEFQRLTVLIRELVHDIVHPLRAIRRVLGSEWRA